MYDIEFGLEDPEMVGISTIYDKEKDECILIDRDGKIMFKFSQNKFYKFLNCIHRKYEFKI